MSTTDLPADTAPSPTGPARTRTVRVIVSGLVQGVGFRWYTVEEASRLGLVGEVGNRADGTVEVLAQGPSDSVARLIAWLYRGPRWAQVDDLRVEERPPGSLGHRNFSVTN